MPKRNRKKAREPRAFSENGSICTHTIDIIIIIFVYGKALRFI